MASRDEARFFKWGVPVLLLLLAIFFLLLNRSRPESWSKLVYSVRPGGRTASFFGGSDHSSSGNGGGKKSDPDQYNPTFNRLTGRNGWISTGAAEWYKLNDEERDEVQTAIDRTRRNVENWARQNMVLDAAASDAGKRVTVYTIKAADDRGESFRSELRSGLSRAVGDERAEVLFAALKPDQDLAGFGKYDVKVIGKPLLPDPSKLGIEIIFAEPQSGIAVFDTSCIPSSIPTYWGDRIKFDFEGL